MSENKFLAAYDVISEHFKSSDSVSSKPLTIQIDDSDIDFIYQVRTAYKNQGYPSNFLPKFYKLLAVRYALLVAYKKGLPLHNYIVKGKEVYELIEGISKNEERFVNTFDDEASAEKWIEENKNILHDASTVFKRKNKGHLPCPMMKIVQLSDDKVTLAFRRASRGSNAKCTWDEVKDIAVDFKSFSLRHQGFNNAAHGDGLISYTRWEELLEPEKVGFGGKKMNPKLSHPDRPVVKGDGHFCPGPRTTDYHGVYNCSKEELDNLKHFRDIVKGTVVKEQKDEIFSYVKDRYQGEVLKNHQGMDVYLPDLKIGFNYLETLWHLESVVGRHLHWEKANEADAAGIRLVQIYEDEWVNKRNIVESRINCKLGISKRVFARKTKIVNLTGEQSTKFLEKTHIQGNYNSTLAYGLEYDGKLVACMTFGISRFTKKYDWELLRYSSDLDTVVIGGADKLLQHFLKETKTNSLISYADRRWSNGNLYKKLNFDLKTITSPGYSYYNICKNELFNRLKIQKNKLKEMFGYRDDLKEYDIMLLNGFDRIWDAGQYTFTQTKA